MLSKLVYEPNYCSIKMFVLSLIDIVPRRIFKDTDRARGSELEETGYKVVTFKPEELVPYNMPLKGKNNFLTKSSHWVSKHADFACRNLKKIRLNTYIHKHPKVQSRSPIKYFRPRLPEPSFCFTATDVGWLPPLPIFSL